MSIRKLAGETAIYGLSSILGRLLYFLLVPLYVRVFTPAEYGVVTDLFSFIGLLLIFYTYRFETAYFRFATDSNPEAPLVYKTALSSIIFTSLVLSGLILLFQEALASWFQYPEFSYLIGICAGILALDAVAEIPLSRLRLESRPMRFAMIRLSGIGVNIGSNLFFLILCPWMHEKGIMVQVINAIYQPEIGIGYIFISNLLASIVQLLLLFPYIKGALFWPPAYIWKRMLSYSIPLILVGISFSINELLDRKIMIWLLNGSPEENKATLGAYGACYKLTMIMALFTQAFRYGSEPFFFRYKNEQNAHQIYAQVAHYYGITGIVGCLFTLLYLDWIKLILHPAYWVALGIIPVLLLANLANGLYYNVSIWYRIKDRTMTGAGIAAIGALCTILLNIWWVPQIGFYGAAYATFICYALMLFICYWLGKKHLPIPYRIAPFFLYLTVAAAMYGAGEYVKNAFSLAVWHSTFFNSLLLALFFTLIIYREKIKPLEILSRLRGHKS